MFRSTTSVYRITLPVLNIYLHTIYMFLRYLRKHVWLASKYLNDDTKPGM